VRHVNATQARKDLYRLIDEVHEGNEAIEIRGPRADAILVAVEEWRAIQETLYLTSVPGMRESLLSASVAPESEFSEDPGWDDSAP
jgi:PHD/YefM family antitoxin component YafN of YafNO toxin-antitoxin module